MSTLPTKIARIIRQSTFSLSIIFAIAFGVLALRLAVVLTFSFAFTIFFRALAFAAFLALALGKALHPVNFHGDCLVILVPVLDVHLPVNTG